MQTNRRARIKYISYYCFLNDCINLSRFDCGGNRQSVPASVIEQASPYALSCRNGEGRRGMWSMGDSHKNTHSYIGGKVSTAVCS